MIIELGRGDLFAQAQEWSVQRACTSHPLAFHNLLSKCFVHGLFRFVSLSPIITQIDCVEVH
jgi:hypothetical protein